MTIVQVINCDFALRKETRREWACEWEGRKSMKRFSNRRLYQLLLLLLLLLLRLWLDQMTAMRSVYKRVVNYRVNKCRQPNSETFLIIKWRAWLAAGHFSPGPQKYCQGKSRGQMVPSSWKHPQALKLSFLGRYSPMVMGFIYKVILYFVILLPPPTALLTLKLLSGIKWNGKKFVHLFV